MIDIAHYVGTHQGDTLTAQAGRWITVATQRGDYKQVSHVEAILDLASDGSVTIASASIRDGRRVRTKAGVFLDPASWRIARVPCWSVEGAREWFAEHDGALYDWRGAMATRIPGHGQGGAFFCNHAVGCSVGLKQAHTFGPHHFAAITFTLGEEITQAFFGSRLLAAPPPK